MITEKTNDMIDRYDNAVSYLQLTDEEKAFLFNNVNIFRGFRFSEKEGVSRGFRDLFEWKDGDLPAYLNPIVNTVEKSDYSFSKITHEVKKMNANTESLAFTSPYASAESEFKHQKENRQGVSSVDEYLLSQHILYKCKFMTDFDRVRITDGFYQAIRNAVHDEEADSREHCLALVKALNEWGYYVPQSFSLGGILYAEEITTVDEMEKASSDREDFSASFSTSFRRIGGSGAYGGSWENDESSSSSKKNEQKILYQIGGAAGASCDYTHWATSMYDPKRWNLVGFDSFYPSLMLLRAYEDDHKGACLLNDCMNLIDAHLADKSLLAMQTVIDLKRYTSSIRNKIYPY